MLLKLPETASLSEHLCNGAFFLGKYKGEKVMTKHKKDDRQSDQSIEESKDKKDTEKKPFDPVEYYIKKLEEKGIKFRKTEPPKDRCWIIFRR
jgi:lipoprotein NlpI